MLQTVAMVSVGATGLVCAAATDERHMAVCASMLAHWGRVQHDELGSVLSRFHGTSGTKVRSKVQDYDHGWC